jgi:hypothetical protein
MTMRRWNELHLEGDIILDIRDIPVAMLHAIVEKWALAELRKKTFPALESEIPPEERTAELRRRLFHFTRMPHLKKVIGEMLKDKERLYSMVKYASEDKNEALVLKWQALAEKPNYKDDKGTTNKEKLIELIDRYQLYALWNLIDPRILEENPDE